MLSPVRVSVHHVRQIFLSLPLHDRSEELLSSFQHEGLARPPALAAF